MVRSVATFVLAIGLAAPAGAHFVFILPARDGKSATAVFSDTPAPDDKVSRKAVELKAARAVNAKGELVELKPDAGWKFDLPDGVVELRATIEYGVVNRGEGHLIRIRHHARAVLGKASDTGAAPLEITPVAGGGGTAFRVTFNGKPLAGADVTVYEPESDVLKVMKTDADGLTAGFRKPGRYAARVPHIDPTAGEHDGRRYAATHHYATLVMGVK